VFWKKKKRFEDNTPLDIPSNKLLQGWVIILIRGLELQEGEFTILPAYGGILLYIRNQGITWIPYKEIKDMQRSIDTSKLVESSMIIGGLAIVNFTGGLALPIIMLPQVIKGWYRGIARPSPKKSVTYLQSMISDVIVEEVSLRTKLLDKFEEIPMRSENEISSTEIEKTMAEFVNDFHIKGETSQPKQTKPIENVKTYTLKINKKIFQNKLPSNKFITFMRHLASPLTGINLDEFAILPHSDTIKFLKILSDNGIKTIRKKAKHKTVYPDDGIII
jgi:hypothetical protein